MMSGILDIRYSSCNSLYDKDCVCVFMGLRGGIKVEVVTSHRDETAPTQSLSLSLSHTDKIIISHCETNWLVIQLA